MSTFIIDNTAEQPSELHSDGLSTKSDPGRTMRLKSYSTLPSSTTTDYNPRPVSWAHLPPSSNEPLHVMPSWCTEPVLSSPSSPRPDLGDLNAEEQEALKAEITSRRAARRVSKLHNRKNYADEDDDDDDRVFFGTRVAEGHRNYPLM